MKEMIFLNNKKLLHTLAFSTAIAMLAGCTSNSSENSETSDKTSYENEVSIVLSDKTILVNDKVAPTDEKQSVHTSNNIIYYEDRTTYESGNTYGEGTDADKHSAEEASAHTVVNISEPGTYRVSGTLNQGQIAIDLGEDAKNDPNSVVTLILDNVDINCTVAPAIIFYNVYECDTNWVAYDAEELAEYEANPIQDTTAAGANVIIVDDTVNNVNGSYVARIYKDTDEEKKLHKYDGAFYSKMSMNVNGEEKNSGVLNITATNEGLNSEVHLTINGGNINIQADNDGINTNEDGVSVTTINGGSLHIVAGLGEEGDGVDSNGYLVINGGVVIAIAKPAADSGLDSDLGSFIHGGTVLATGSTMEWAESDSNQVTMNLQFTEAQGADEAIIVTDVENNVLFAYDPDEDETTGSHNRAYQGAIISSPKFAVGETYHVYVGGTVNGTEQNGLYDVSTITSFDGATRQQYAGNTLGMFGGQMPNGMNPGEAPTPPEGMEPGQMPEGAVPPTDGEIPTMPEGATPPMNGEPPALPDGTTPPMNGERPTLPDGTTPPMNNGERPTLPDGTTPPMNNGERPALPDGTALEAQASSINFYMEDKVNAFSDIKDEQNEN